MSRRVRLLVTCLLGLVLAGGLSTLLVGDDADVAVSADLNRFDPGNIITDGVFYDTSTMDVGAIQSFIELRGATCVGGKDGSPCLKNYVETTWTRAADNRCGAYTGGVDSAAWIVYKVAKACGINPQVLLVMLQKEQGLLRTTDPKASNYRSAMGYGCPDTAVCDSQYYGFYNQLYSAARQLKNYQANPAKYGYKPNMWNSIGYYPATEKGNNLGDWRCGRVDVYIRNQATAALYNYTPYVPNAAALAAGYGEGDACSSYGNRNFYSYFVDWFSSTQFSAGAAIWEKNVALKSAGVNLGTPTNDVTCDQPGGGCWQRYPGGIIYWSQSSGAHVVRGGILERYWSLGGPSGSMGYPISDDAATPGANGYYTNFQGGDIVWSAATGTRVVRGAILEAWRSTGAAAGYLGFPVGDDASAGRGGFLTEFQGGTVYWSASSGAHIVRGAILQRYQEMGGPAALGFPTGDDRSAGDGRGYMTTFQGGELYWSAETDTHVIRGALLAKYRALGGPAALGYPVADDRPIEGGHVSVLEYGSIYWSAASDAHVVRGAILQKYLALGGPRGYGFPIGDDAATPGANGYYTNFQAGDIVWSAAGAHTVRGGILAAWRSTGAAAGYLGFPVGDDTGAAGGGYLTDFQYGSIYWSAGTGTHVVRGAILQAYRTLGGPGVLGYPTRDDAPTPGANGYVTTFQGGEIYWSAATGAHVVRGGILAAWRATGGPAGYLGFPSGDDTAAAGGGYLTDFQYGSIYWSAATGTHVVRGAILQAYRTLGGPGVLGYPTGDDAATPGANGYVTTFQGGEIYWSAATGAHVVRGAVLASWKATGGPAGFLGFPTTDDAVAPGGGGTFADFTGGSVYWSAATGAHWVRTAVNDAYRAAGGTTSSYGYPISDTYPVAGGQRVDFQNGQLTA